MWVSRRNGYGVDGSWLQLLGILLLLAWWASRHTPQPSAFSASPTERADLVKLTGVFAISGNQTGFLGKIEGVLLPVPHRSVFRACGLLTKLRVVQHQHLVPPSIERINTIDRQVSAPENAGTGVLKSFPCLGEFQKFFGHLRTDNMPKSPPPVLHFPSR